MLVILKENLLPKDFDRLLHIVGKYGIEVINANCFKLPNDVSFLDLNALQQDMAVDKIVMNNAISVENIVMTYAQINE